MKKNKLILHYEKKVSDFQKHFDSTLTRQSMEDIHDLRVAIKKMRAVLSLIEILSKKDFSKDDHFKLFSRLFKSCGKVREAQINLGLILKFADLLHIHPYYVYLENLQAKHSQRMQTELAAFDMNKLNKLNHKLRKKASQYDESTILKNSIDYALNEFKKIIEIKDLIQKNDVLHKIRIHLKAAMEVLSLVCQLSKTKEAHLYREEIKSLAEIIGNWHDYVALNDSIKKFIDKQQKNREIHHWRILNKKIANRNNRRKKRIKKLIELYLNEEKFLLLH